MNKPIQTQLEIRTNSRLLLKQEIQRIQRPPEISAIIPRILEAIRDQRFAFAGQSFGKNTPVRNPAADGQAFAIIRLPLPRIAPPRWPDDPNSSAKRQRIAIYFDNISEPVTFEMPIRHSSGSHKAA